MRKWIVKGRTLNGPKHNHTNVNLTFRIFKRLFFQWCLKVMIFNVYCEQSNFRGSDRGAGEISTKFPQIILEIIFGAPPRDAFSRGRRFSLSRARVRLFRRKRQNQRLVAVSVLLTALCCVENYNRVTILKATFLCVNMLQNVEDCLTSCNRNKMLC